MTQKELKEMVQEAMAKSEYQIRSEQIRRGIKAKKDRQMKMITNGGPIVVVRVSKTSRN